MRIYFVRHGESKYNALELYQHGDVPLLQNGAKQAKTVARRFKKIPIDIIITSHYKRAQQTTDAINAVVQKK